MPRRGASIRINPQRRYDLSHLTPDEGKQALCLFLQDLCFWGHLPKPVPVPVSSHYHDHVPAHAELLRWQSSGSDSKSSKRRSSSQNGRTDNRPPREQSKVVRNWKTAVDPASGQTYYFDPVTRQTQWEKVSIVWFALNEISKKKDHSNFEILMQNWIYFFFVVDHFHSLVFKTCILCFNDRSTIFAA